jgi:hypothetical protein
VDFRALIGTPAVRPFLANQSDRRADVQFNDGVAEFLANEIDVKPGAFGTVAHRQCRVFGKDRTFRKFNHY